MHPTDTPDLGEHRPGTGTRLRADEDPDVGPVVDGPDVAAAIERWSARFEASLRSGGVERMRDLFCPESYWRDVASLTDDLGHTSGSDAIARRLVRVAIGSRPHEIRLKAGSTPPAIRNRFGREVAEGIIEYRTADGTGRGIVRLPVEELHRDAPRAWILLTMARSVRGLPVPGEPQRHPDVGYDRSTTANWRDRRMAATEFAGREPEVLIVGGGHAGLMTASHFALMGVDALVVEKTPRVGDVWRDRYHSLALHNHTDMMHFPYMPFPATFPRYLPKDQLANWLEAFAVNTDVTIWTSTEFLGGEYDDAAGRWRATVARPDGTTRVLRPRHVVVATGGAGAQPNIPDLPGASDFRGPVLHSSQFHDAAPWTDKAVLVVGTGTSGHDLALDLHQHGAAVTMMQRSPTLVISRDSSELAILPEFEDGTPLPDADLAAAANFILPLMRPAMQAMTRTAESRDREILTRLRDAGLELHSGVDGTGFIFKFYNENGGYYIDVGCSEAIASGAIEIVQAADLEHLDESGARFRDGHRPFDLVVLATGFKNQQEEVRRYFGESVADALGPISGFGEDGELRNVCRPTAQPGLWFMVSGLAFGRTYSAVLALQITAALVADRDRHTATGQAGPDPAPEDALLHGR